MSIGFACLTVGVQNTDFKSCILKNCDKEKFLSVVDNNLKSLTNILDYNQKNRIKLFRISSDLIPFGSSCNIPESSWDKIFSSQFEEIGEKIKKYGIRVSLHPGQYTVLNSPNLDVVSRAIEDLKYHCKILDLMGLDSKNKIILHIGGIYGDKALAVNRFKENYLALDDYIKSRLVIENDDKLFNIEDVLSIGNSLNIPVVYDNLHNLCNKINDSSDASWINEASKTWGQKDGKQKIHYSQQSDIKRMGAHSETINVVDFLEFYNSLSNKNIDIMLEVKDKNISAIKCINSLETNNVSKHLDIDWSRYKYLVLERSEKIYLEIRQLLKDKTNISAVDFYCLIDKALSLSENRGQVVNAVQHVWGYFKEKTSEKEKVAFLNAVKEYQEGRLSVNILKKKLYNLSLKNKENYLLDSYYFNDVL